MLEKIVKDRLTAINEHVSTIEKRMKEITKPSDFRTKNGSVMFDAILIRLQALGENIKKIEEVQPGFIGEKLTINVDNIIRFRDLISHHYEKLDTEIIFNIVKEHIPVLKSAVKKHLQENSLLPKKIKKAAVKKQERKL